MLFYTDAATWGTDGKQLTAEQILKNSAHKVTLQNCGSDHTGYAGMLLVTHPGCFSLGIKQNGAGEESSDEVSGVQVGVSKQPC